MRSVQLKIWHIFLIYKVPTLVNRLICRFFVIDMISHINGRERMHPILAKRVGLCVKLSSSTTKYHILLSTVSPPVTTSANQQYALSTDQWRSIVSFGLRTYNMFTQFFSHLKFDFANVMLRLRSIAFIIQQTFEGGGGGGGAEKGHLVRFHRGALQLGLGNVTLSTSVEIAKMLPC